MANQRRTKEKKEKERRPTSDHDKKVDVHLLVVPSSLWRPDLRFAYNTICIQSISCGFVRALPSISLKSLRDEISQQLDCSLFPSTFVFLKSIGKCLTWVTSKQEAILKLRVFLPPLAPCPEIYILDATYLQLPEGAASLPPLSTPQHPMVQGHHLYDARYGYMHHGNAYPTPYYPQQQLHPSHGSHPHSCTPPTLMPNLPTMQESGVSTSINCFGGQNDSYSTGHHHHHLDQIHNVMTTDNQHHNNAAALSHKKKSRRDKHREPEMEQMQAQYLHHGNGLTDLDDCSNGSRVRPYNQQVSQSRGYHPMKSSCHDNAIIDPGVDPFNQQADRSRGNDPSNALYHEKGLMDLNDYYGSRGRPSNNPSNDPRNDNYGSMDYNNHELLQEAPYGHQQSAYNSKIGHTSGAKHAHGHSANRYQETNEPNKGHHLTAQYQDYNSTNTFHTQQQKVSLRHQSQGAYNYPSPVKSIKSNNQSDASNSKGRHNRSDLETDSGDGSHDQVSSNKKKRNIQHQNQDQAGTGEIAGGADDAAQLLQDPHSVSNSGSGDQRDDGIMEPNYNEIKGSYSMAMSDLPNAEDIANEEHGEEEAGTQIQGIDVQKNSGQEFNEQGNSDQRQQLGSQKSRNYNAHQSTSQYNAPKQPKQTRKVAQKPNRTGGGGGIRPGRKHSATHPPPMASDRAKDGLMKGESKKKQSRTVTNGGSHVLIPGTRQGRNFSKPAANQHPSDNNLMKSTSRNDEFSRRLPLPPISSDVSKGSVAKKSSIKLVSKSQSKVNRPSTQQTNEILAQIRRMKEECEELSSNKAELSSVLRTMQYDIRTQREQADKEWKRKYFQEKKFTSTLEDRIRRSKDDIQQLQRHLDRKQGNHLKDSLHTTSVSTEAPSELSNMKIRCKKNQALIESQRATLDAAKKRLAAERNARKTLENECKDLRRELLEKKIACTRTKRQPVSTQS